MDIISIIVFFTVGFCFGKTYAYFRIAKLLKNTLEDVGIDIEELKGNPKEESEITISKLEVESHGDMLYLFDRESHTFICQALTVQELATLAKEYKQVVCAVVKHGDRVFTFNDGQSTEYPV